MTSLVGPHFYENTGKCPSIFSPFSYIKAFWNSVIMGICFSKNNVDTILRYTKKGSTRDFSAFWNYLFPFLNEEDLKNLAKVSRQFHHLVNSRQSNRKSEKTRSEIRKASVE